MKYVTSESGYECNIDGFIIPKRQYSEYEVSIGKSAVLALSDEEYKKLVGNAFFNKRVQSGIFVVADTAPFDKLSFNEKVAVYQNDTAKVMKDLEYMKKVDEKKDRKIEDMETDIATMRALLEEKDKEIAKLKEKKK